MVNLNCQVVLIPCHLFKIILNISLKKHETLTVIFPTHVYNRINNRLRFKMKKSKLARIRNARNNNNMAE